MKSAILDGDHIVTPAQGIVAAWYAEDCGTSSSKSLGGGSGGISLTHIVNSRFTRALTISGTSGGRLVNTNFGSALGHNFTGMSGTVSVCPVSKKSYTDNVATKGSETITDLFDTPVSDTAYDATSFNGITNIAPSKNVFRDQVETMLTSIASVQSEVDAEETARAAADVTTLASARRRNLATNATMGSDFLTGTLEGLLTFASGTGASVGAMTSPAATNPGVARMTTGTTTTGLAIISGNLSTAAIMILGGGETIFEAVVRVDALSDGTDTYTAAFGLTGTSGSITPSNGIIITYTHGTNSGNFTLRSSKAAAATSVDMGTPMSSSAFVRVGWKLNAAGTSIQGFIGDSNGNDVNAGTAISTNIPIVAILPDFFVLKSAGTTSRNFYMDAWSLHFNLAVAR
jgi:hypothetical protein